MTLRLSDPTLQQLAEKLLTTEELRTFTVNGFTAAAAPLPASEEFLQYMIERAAELRKQAERIDSLILIASVAKVMNLPLEGLIVEE